MGSLLIKISIDEQRLLLLQGPRTVMDCKVSTGRNGPGERNGSECTPRGRHVIRAKIGAGRDPNTVFVGRRASGEVYSAELRRRFPARDWILTRILWLSGKEVGRNRLGNVDTMRRHIYLHGSPAEDPMGIAGSHGCIKMCNADVIELFDRAPTGTVVNIQESGFDL